MISYDGIPMLISPLPRTIPLIIFVNPKSGGRQGARLVTLIGEFPEPKSKLLINIHNFIFKST